MRTETSGLHPSPTQQNLYRRATPLLGGRWRRPTFREFVERLELEFGVAPAGSGLYLLGLGKDERLAPGDIKALCVQLGIPPEDFGVEP